MGWEKGRYYTRTRRVDGVHVHEYFGCGPEAARAAREDIEARDRRRAQPEAEQLERDTDSGGPPLMPGWSSGLPPPVAPRRMSIDP